MKGKREKEQGTSTILLLVCLVSAFSFSLVPFPLSLVPSPFVFAQPLPPALTDTVNDFAGVINETSARELDRRIRALQQATGDVVVVATVQTFKPYADIREYAVKMFENHGRGIGEQGKHNGLLIVLAVDDRRVDIEVGYGLEEFITDGYAGATIREVMLPEFRNGSYGRGLLAGATRIISRIAERRGVTLQDVPRDSSMPQTRVNIPLSTILFVILLLWIAGRASRRRRRRYWGVGPWSGWNSGVGPFGGGFGGGFGGFGGGAGGGFGGFGGGRSGGGGAAGSW